MCVTVGGRDICAESHDAAEAAKYGCPARNFYWMPCSHGQVRCLFLHKTRARRRRHRAWLLVGGMYLLTDQCGRCMVVFCAGIELLVQ